MYSLHHPEIRFHEAIREMCNVKTSKEHAQGKIFARLWTDLFGHDSSAHDFLNGGVGAYNRKWASRYRKDIEKIFGYCDNDSIHDNPIHVSKATLEAAKAWLAKIWQVQPGKYGIDRQWKAKLSDFSEWLATLDSVMTRIELPGQYTARK